MAKGTKKQDAVAKASKAVDAAVKGKKVSKQKKTYRHPTFRRPKTLIHRSENKPRSLVPKLKKLDDFRILKTPLTTEAALKKVEMHNTLVFLCDIQATKPQIRKAVADRYKVKVTKVNTLIRPDCQKKAFVRLAKEHDALELANKIGIL